MARLNIKSTKAAFVKELKALEIEMYEAVGKANTHKIQDQANYAQYRILALAKELEIKIKPEDYK